MYIRIIMHFKLFSNLPIDFFFLKKLTSYHFSYPVGTYQSITNDILFNNSKYAVMNKHSEMLLANNKLLNRKYKLKMIMEKI